MTLRSLDLGMKPLAPNSRDFTMIVASSWAETMTTGICGYWPRNSTNPEKPYAPGMFRSSSTRSQSAFSVRRVSSSAMLATSTRRTSGPRPRVSA
ncbi:hypothetical protein D3C73_1447490 [compost metagenome]